MNRKKEREALLKVLFEKDLNSDSNAIAQFNDNLFIESLFKDIEENKNRIDSIISGHLKDWSIERLPAVDRSILRIALAEILYRDEIPLSVSINEAVELAKKFSDEKSAKFINGLLGNLNDEEL
ncbi:MAG: transcription antitermination factor NusB [Clostridiales bacterium]|nr:MAG: transcription antitermination factor NusB [Clostridiales bacterium]